MQHELSSSFSLFFFAPKSDLTHSMKKMPGPATFLCCGLQVWSRQGVQVWSRKCKSGHAGMTRRLSSALLYVPRAWYNLSRHDYSVTQKDASPFTKKARWWHVGNLLYQPPHRYPLPIELRLYSYFHAESVFWSGAVRFAVWSMETHMSWMTCWASLNINHNKYDGRRCRLLPP